MGNTLGGNVLGGFNLDAGLSLILTADGDLLIRDNAGNITRLGIGNALDLLQTNAAGNEPEWDSLQAILKAILTTNGDILFRDNAGNITRLAKGAAYRALAMNAAATVPNWETIQNLVAQILTTNGDILFRNNAGVIIRLAKGAAGQVLTMNPAGTEPAWIAPAGGGPPTGSIIGLGDDTVPAGYLECNGAAVSRAVYAALWGVIGTRYGNGDGATTFTLPDLRGKFPRGWDHGAGNDPDAATRTAQAAGGQTGDNVGSIQADELKSHRHKITGYYTGISTYVMSILRNNTTPKDIWSHYTGGNETRPINVYVMYIIKT